jgi:hypothetical protein
VAEEAMIKADNAHGSLQAGDVPGAGEMLRGLGPERIEEAAIDAFLKADPMAQQQALRAVLSSPTGAGQPGSRRTQAQVQRAREIYRAILDPSTPFGQYVDGLKTVTSQHVPGVQNSTPPYQTLRDVGINGPFDRDQFHWDELQRRAGG